MNEGAWIGRIGRLGWIGGRCRRLLDAVWGVFHKSVASFLSVLSVASQRAGLRAGTAAGKGDARGGHGWDG